MAEPSAVLVGAAKVGLPAISRGVSLLFSKVMRLRRIEESQQGKVETALAKTAVSDYQTYIALVYGQYSVNVRDFHEELLRSGVVDAMIELAIVGRESNAVKNAFNAIFERFLSDTDHNRDEIFSQMTIALGASAEAMVNDPALLRFAQSFSKQINYRLDLIEATAGTNFDTIDANQITETIKLLVSGLSSQFRTLKVETLSGVARDVDVTDIYVPPSLRLISNSRQLDTITESLPSPDAARLRRRRHIAPRRDIATQLTSFSYSELKSSFNRVVILGDPGGGKSTLCQRICYDLTRSTQLALDHPGTNRISPEDQRVPIRVILRLYEQARTASPQLDLLSYIVKQLRNLALTKSEDQIRESVLYLLKTGRATLAFDGLDEILETSNRRTFVEQVMALCDQFPLCSVLVTSRFVGYDSAPLPKDFDKLVLSRFDDDEVNDYSTKFLKHIGDLPTSDVEEETRRFMSQTRENASDLRRNPLMLGLMLWIFLSKGDVPSNRPAIYSECASLMFDKWDSNRSIRPTLPRGFDRAQVFSGIAGKIYPDRMLRAGVTRDWLIKHLQSYFQSKFIDPADAFDAAQSLTDFLVGRAWVMMESGDGIFSFTHQTFLEYFYARHLVNENDDILTLFKVIRSSIIKKESEVVNHLAIQIRTNSNDRIQRQAIDHMLAYYDKLTNKDSRHALISFAAKSMEYLSPSEFDVRRVMKPVFDFTVANEMKGKENPLNTAVSSCYQLRDFAANESARLLIQAITDVDEEISEKAVGYLVECARAKWTGSDVAVPVDDIARMVRRHIAEKAETSAKWAGIAFALFADITEDRLRRYGPSVIWDHELITGFESVSGLDGISLALAPNFHPRYIRGPITIEAVRQASIAVGRVALNYWSSHTVAPKRRKRLSIPIEVWREIFDHLKEEPDLIPSALYAYHLSLPDHSHIPSDQTEFNRISTILRGYARKQKGRLPDTALRMIDEIVEAGRKIPAA